MRIYLIPKHSIIVLSDKTYMVHGNYLPFNNEQKWVYLGNIFTTPLPMLEKYMRKLHFDAVKKDGFARYVIRTIASMREGDIAIVKKGNCTIDVYRIGKMRLYKAYYPPDEYIEEHREDYEIPSYEEYYVELEYIGSKQIDKNLYNKLKIGRAISEVKNRDNYRALLGEISEMEGNSS
ncbi:MAG: hypothetical protein GXO26_08805 [Crenarchaeota archaeon]|nr:hypothetical protein [Thermoproteota archaeon]